MQIIDGNTDEPNIYADDIGQYNISLFGSSDYVLPVGEQLSYELISNNEVQIKDGVFVTQGRRGIIKKGTVESCVIENGTQNEYRNDLIIIEYSKDEITQIESHTLKVVKGTPGEEATDPEITTGDIPSGAVLHQMPLYRVKLEGLNVTAVEQLFSIGKIAPETVDPMVTTEEGFAADAKLTGDAIQQCFQYASDGKTAIAEAITGMGISGVSSDMTFSELAGKLADYKALKTQTSYTIFTYGSSVPYPDLTGAFNGTWSLGSATTQAGVRTATGVTEKAIDLTNVKTLIATCSFRTTGDRTVYATFGVQQTAGTFTKSSQKSATSTGDSNTTNTISIDVSSLSGSYYLGCSLQDHTYCMSRISKIVMVMK